MMHTQELARNYPIGIPSYFGLIIRAFGTLEGLGLSMDPRYSIVKECFPYLARRLLTEDTPRMRKMLRSFLYGKDGTVLQVHRNLSTFPHTQSDAERVWSTMLNSMSALVIRRLCGEEVHGE